MKIAVINGSPKGKYSITLQTVRYLERKFPEHEFVTLHAGQTIRALERDFTPARELLASADAVMFSYPVYTFLAPSQLHRFIELMKADGVDMTDKYATQITTSKHFYDVTAHKYVEENALDLGMRYIRGLSADMEDLLTEGGRSDAEKFFERFLWSIESGVFTKGERAICDFTPATASVPESSCEKKERDVVIITDEVDGESNLSRMIERFRAVFGYTTRVVNISEYKFSGGCLGCFRCAVSEKCVYKDGFDSFLRDNIQRADAIVYAFSVRDHSMGSRFKMYDDRNFCNGHRTVTVGMPIGYLLSGEYEREENLRMIVEGRAEVGRNFLAGVATDEHDTDRRIDEMAEKLAYALENKLVTAQNFLGVGGMKIFRDLIYQMRGMMRADHKFYKKGGYYNDFPQKHWQQSLLMYLVGFMLGNEKIKKKIGNKMNEGMLMPYTKVLNDLDKSLNAQNK